MSERRVALVTGANRGLGYALAAGLARPNMSIVVTARDSRDAHEAAARLRAQRPGVEVEAHQLDVTDPASVFRAFAETQRSFGRLDVLLSSAGIAIDRGRTPSVLDMEKVRATLDTNLLGAWRCAAEAIPIMRKNNYGRIVHVSSRMGSLANMTSSSPAYRVSKAALNALTRVLADEVAQDNILVNSASPGVAATRMNYGGKAVSPEEAAQGMIWLATAPDDGPRGEFFEGRSVVPW
ncbi:MULTISPECIES: SDR family NAD(P)-dependent oxidoreductase [Streptomyces]|uniref:SDR family NAD(P)-dependent oxidoreductase n=1 Tax=Streptomyces evansiae TaxID=3075535 RepID=A0ABU2QV26_9ACTN|nr:MULTISPECIES: SDR family NAD(P)-dependent oxidoreductase [unclassified Streptomyces]MDT0407806.1 SDR family NAD(P)-dependent oxidoreductase [Streptomyces sp. DSM 41979]MYQ60872.1 SDR family NAD(P)-dependent oxidoreductase [Streptomyces sp. SID4926]